MSAYRIGAIFALLLGGACLLFSAEDKPSREEAQLTEAKALLAKDGERDKALNLLQSLCKKKEAAVSCPAKALLARELYNDKLTEKALKVLEGCDDFAKLNGRDAELYLLPFLELARLQAIQGNTLNAFKMLDYATNKFPSAPGKARSMLRFTETQLDISRPEDAKAWLDKYKELEKTAQKAPAQISPSDTPPPKNPVWAELAKEYEILALRTEIALLAEECGQDYANYVLMREYYDRKNYTKSLETARKLIETGSDTVYAQYARLCEARCLLQMGHPKDAEKALRKFIETQPNGIYRGEAWMELGRIELETNWDAKKSLEAYEQALSWFRKARELKDASSLYSISEKVKKYAIPKEKITSLDEWFRPKSRKVSSRELINENTAPWYIDENEKECLFTSGFLLMVDDKFAEAKERFEKVSSVDTDLAMLEAKHIPNAILRLKGACTQKYLYLTPAELKFFKGPDKLKVFLAELNLALERYERSDALYSEFLKSKVPEQVACAMLIRGKLAIHMGKHEEALRILEEALKLSRKMPDIYPHALFMTACLYGAYAKPDKYEEFLRKTIAEDTKGTYGHQSQSRLSVMFAMRGDLDKARTELNKLTKSYQPQKDELDYLEKILAYCEQKKDKLQSEYLTSNSAKTK